MESFTRALQRLGIPFASVSYGNETDRSTWVITYLATATAAQRAQGEGLKFSYDPTTDTADQDERALASFNDQKLIKAVAIWTAGKLAIPLATARSEILAIYKGL